jgi:DNA-binding LytR/AlgR family response regulator
MLRCAIIDDEPLAIELLRDYIGRVPALKLLLSAEDALSAAELLKKHPVDLVFTDINMPDISGMDLIRSLKPAPLVIFTTAYKRFAFEGFELEAVDYLLKPIDFGRFTKAVDKALLMAANRKPAASENEGESVCVYVNYALVKVPLNRIEYIEGMQDYIKIHLSDGSSILTLLTLKKMLSKLPPGKFLQIHRSYIVSLSKIRSLARKKLRLSSAEIAVGDSYLPGLMQRIKG